MTDNMRPATPDGQPVSVVPIPVQYRASSSVIPAALPPSRVAAEMHVAWRVTSALVGVATLIFAAVLAWHEDTEGVASAAAFAVAVLALVFAFAGVVPASVKVGDIDIKLHQAEQAGKSEGAEATGLNAFMAGAKCAQKVKARELDLETVKTEVLTALSSHRPINLQQTETTVPVPTLDREAANARANEIVDVLSSMSE